MGLLKPAWDCSEECRVCVTTWAVLGIATLCSSREVGPGRRGTRRQSRSRLLHLRPRYVVPQGWAE